jgi:hypothetical protein
LQSMCPCWRRRRCRSQRLRRHANGVTRQSARRSESTGLRSSFPMSESSGS